MVSKQCSRHHKHTAGCTQAAEIKDQTYDRDGGAGKSGHGTMLTENHRGGGKLVCLERSSCVSEVAVQARRRGFILREMSITRPQSLSYRSYLKPAIKFGNNPTWADSVQIVIYRCPAADRYTKLTSLSVVLLRCQVPTTSRSGCGRQRKTSTETMRSTVHRGCVQQRTLPTSVIHTSPCLPCPTLARIRDARLLRRQNLNGTATQDVNPVFTEDRECRG